MTTMADGSEGQDASKSAFMEFGQQPPQQQQPPPPPPPQPQPHSQQSSPAMAGAHYPLHCLHSAAAGSHHHHHQHHHHGSPYASGGGNSYNHRSLAAYPYVSHSQHSPYLQSYHNSSAAAQTRGDDTGERPPGQLASPASRPPRSLPQRPGLRRPPPPGGPARPRPGLVRARSPGARLPASPSRAPSRRRGPPAASRGGPPCSRVSARLSGCASGWAQASLCERVRAALFSSLGLCSLGLPPPLPAPTSVRQHWGHFWAGTGERALLLRPNRAASGLLSVWCPVSFGDRERNWRGLWLWLSW